MLPNPRDSWFVVINPSAGGGKGLRRWPRIQAELHRQHISHQHCITRDLVSAQAEISAAVNNGFRKFISVGGDGSHHTLINALNPASCQVVVAIIPVGTGNDWARTFGISRQVRRSIAHIA
ncbi:MAG: acylglycerol kinase family protein, partial [Saprospiraceae bacterium]|nr:acylglycerol kinase family protein [Saprospiraceae bacterium]